MDGAGVEDNAGWEMAGCCCARKGDGSDDITDADTASAAINLRLILKKGLPDKDAIILRPSSG